MVNDTKDGDGFGDLLDHLQERDSCIYTMGGGEAGYGVAVFPKVIETDEEFEKACLKMMANQQALPPLPEKPSNTSLRDKRRGITRGD